LHLSYNLVQYASIINHIDNSTVAERNWSMEEVTI